MSGGVRTLKAAMVTVGVFRVLNIVAAVGLIAAIVLSVPFEPWIAAHLAAKYGAGVAVAPILLATRLMLAVGLAAAAAVHVVFTRLLAILKTVRGGDPFTAANAGRLRDIGWALLALQLLDLSLGGFTAWFAALHVRSATWSPDIGGWIAVLMAFVLAGVFARGAAMRDDLAMTV